MVPFKPGLVLEERRERKCAGKTVLVGVWGTFRVKAVLFGKL